MSKNIIIAGIIASALVVAMMLIVGVGGNDQSSLDKLNSLDKKVGNLENSVMKLGKAFEGISAYLGAGTRFTNGISADSTSPSAGEVRGTTLTITDDAAITDNATIGGTLVVSETLNSSKTATSTQVDLTLTSDESGKLILFKTTGATSTLPAVTNTGAYYVFSVKEAFDTNNFVITSAEGDNINGSLFVNDAIVACSGEDKINFVSDGEQIGDFVELISDGTNWNIINSRGETAAKITCTDPS